MKFLESILVKYSGCSSLWKNDSFKEDLPWVTNKQHNLFKIALTIIILLKLIRGIRILFYKNRRLSRAASEGLLSFFLIIDDDPFDSGKISPDYTKNFYLTALEITYKSYINKNNIYNISINNTNLKPPGYSDLICYYFNAVGKSLNEISSLLSQEKSDKIYLIFKKIWDGQIQAEKCKDLTPPTWFEYLALSKQKGDTCINYILEMATLIAGKKQLIFKELLDSHFLYQVQLDDLDDLKNDILNKTHTIASLLISRAKVAEHILNNQIELALKCARLEGLLIYSLDDSFILSPNINNEIQYNTSIRKLNGYNFSVVELNSDNHEYLLRFALNGSFDEINLFNQSKNIISYSKSYSQAFNAGDYQKAIIALKDARITSDLALSLKMILESTKRNELSIIFRLTIFSKIEKYANKIIKKYL